ncbi:MAG: hypothetical protein I3J02_03430 [Prevotella sp.]|nr:hypothetical protein [Prevotella sp.]
MTNFTTYSNNVYNEVTGNPYLQPSTEYQVQLVYVLKGKYLCRLVAPAPSLPLYTRSRPSIPAETASIFFCPVVPWASSPMIILPFSHNVACIAYRHETPGIILKIHYRSSALNAAKRLPYTIDRGIPNACYLAKVKSSCRFSRLALATLMRTGSPN